MIKELKIRHPTFEVLLDFNIQELEVCKKTQERKKGGRKELKSRSKEEFPIKKNLVLRR